jgi:hypothetical protein
VRGNLKGTRVAVGVSVFVRRAVAVGVIVNVDVLVGRTVAVGKGIDVDTGVAVGEAPQAASAKPMDEVLHNLRKSRRVNWVIGELFG